MNKQNNSTVNHMTTVKIVHMKIKLNYMTNANLLIYFCLLKCELYTCEVEIQPLVKAGIAT